MSNKICLQSIISIVTSNKNELCETVVLTRFQKRQLQSVLILFRFLHPFAERFILFEQLLLFFTQFGDNSLRLNFDKFRYTPFNQRNVSIFLIGKSRPEVEVCQNL